MADMEVDSVAPPTVVTMDDDRSKRGASEDPLEAAKRMRREALDDDDDDDAPAAPAQMTAAEREQAERLHQRAVRAEALAAARTAAKERGVALSAEEVSALKKEESAKPTFLTKAQREAAALARLEQKRKDREAAQKADRAAKKGGGAKAKFSEPPPKRDPGGAADAARLPRAPRYEPEPEPAPTAWKKPRKDIHGRPPPPPPPPEAPAVSQQKLHDQELRAIRENYLGKGAKQKKVVKPSEKFARIFQFDWNAADDTSQDLNPLYARRHAVQPMLGRGYIAGLDMREQRRTHTFSQTLSDKRMAEERATEEAEGLARAERKKREEARKKEREAVRKAVEAEDAKIEAKTLGKKLFHWSEKPLEEMNERDWRIMKEDFDIRIRGGKAPHPMRHWAEAGFKEGILKAIQDAGYKEATPIQRQAIPVGLELRDLIGIAETGSGKTAAFAIPLLQYVASLPPSRVASLDEDGPLAIIMAPTRELAQQICSEIQKLGKYLTLKAMTVVGGKSIEDQGFLLREGVEIIVGTPGRINDCLESQYLVLNQANYVVLDEADRMIDMGFEPQVNDILDQMGGLLMAEDEVQLEQQREALRKGEACFRITHMFSATMPPAVEKLAKKFLRFPAIVCIGDEDSGKNKRIQQRVMMISEKEKKDALVTLLRQRKPADKIIIFCNERKGCDALHKVIQNAQIRSAVLHGGKTQDHRDATLDAYKRGAVSILVATDVAGRGLDIPDVAHVINYDMPLKIENYTHRIGRTGRAGKDGLASTLLTDSDEAMYYELHEYLTQTDAPIPTKLEKHPAAHAKPGERNDRGELLTNKASQRGVQFLDASKFEQG